MGNHSRILTTTETSIRIVEAIQSLEGATLMELSEELSLAPSTLHAHLGTLEKNKYLVKEDNTYQVGLEFYRIGAHVRNRHDKYNIISDAVNRLASEASGGVNYLIEEHGKVYTLYDKVGGASSFNSPDRQEFYMHSTAAGKAILAEYTDDEIEAIIDRHGLPRQTEQTITNRADLFEELETVRDQGYAINDEERMDGLRSVGIAVKDPNNRVLGSLTISDLSYRMMSGVPERDLLETLKDTAAYITERMDTESDV